MPLSNATYGKGDTMSDNDTTSTTSSEDSAQKDPAQVAPNQPVENERVENAGPGEEAPGISHNDSPGGTPEMDDQPGPAAPQLHPEVFDHGDRPDDEPSA